MKSAPRYPPEQWAEAQRLRAEGLTFPAIATRLGFAAPRTIADRARREGWPDGRPRAAAAAAAKPKPKPSPKARAKPRATSPDIAESRRRLTRRLYKIVEVRTKKMELSMQKQLEALEQSADGIVTPAMAQQERDGFAALIESINQVTEMASELALADDGRRKSAGRNPELTALSDDIDADGLAAASEKDQLRREIAEQLEKLLPPA